YLLTIDEQLKDDALISLYDVQKGMKLWTKVQQYDNTCRQPFFNGENEAGFIDGDSKLSILKLSNGDLVSQQPLERNVLPANSRVQQELNIEVLEGSTELSRLVQKAMVDNGSFSFGSFKDNTLKLFDKDGKKLAD